MDIIEQKKECLKKYFEGITAYTNYLLYSIEEDPEAKNIYKYDLESALLSLVSFNLIYNKENIIENKGSLKYETKLYNFILDEYMILIAPGKTTKYELGDYKTDSSEEMFAYIRNKLAHGDYYIDGCDVVLNHETSLPRININLLASINVAISKCLINGFKETRYERQMVCNKVMLHNTENIYDVDINELLSLTIFKKIILMHKKNEIIDIEIKNELESDIERLKKVWSTLDKAEIKNEEEKLIKKYDKYNCLLTFENKKIKDQEKINQIKTGLNGMRELLEPKCKNVQVNMLGTLIHEAMTDNYESDCIWMGAIYNQHILKDIIITNDSDYKKILENSGSKSMAQGTVNQLIAAFLAQFCVLYLYPLDDIYKINNDYRLKRPEELDFSKLDMDVFKPSVYNYKNKFEDIEENRVESLRKKLEGLELKKEGKEESLKTIKNKLMDKSEQQMIIKKIESIISDMEKSIEIVRNEYHNELRYFWHMQADYKYNELYFKNKNIIEGIRNAIAHGNVRIINLPECYVIGDALLNFKDYDNNELVMDLTIKVKDFQILFKDYNRKVITDFLDNKIEKNKFNYYKEREK